MTWRKVRRWARDVRAVAAIEFALLAPVIVVLVVGTIETAHIVTVQVTLDGAVSEAARAAAVTLDQSEDERDQVMREYIARRMSAFPIADDGEVKIETTAIAPSEVPIPKPTRTATRTTGTTGPAGAFPVNRSTIETATAYVTPQCPSQARWVAPAMSSPIPLNSHQHFTSTSSPSSQAPTGLP